jgi:transposase
LTDIHHQGFIPEECPIMESMGKKPRRRRSLTPKFKAEIDGLCQQGDRPAGQVAKDFNLTETAVREWVKRGGTRRGDPQRRPDQH